MKPFAELGNIEGPDQMARARRSQMYRFLAESFRYPDKEFYRMAKDGSFLQSALAILRETPFEVQIEEGALSGQLLKGVSQDDFEAEFVRVFEGGPGGPPCPLIEGKYADNRMGNMEELVRFYNHFGLSVAEAREREVADHITSELEFMHYLTFKEVLALQRGEDPLPYCSAETDFLARHLAKWLPQLHKRTEGVFRANIPKLCEPAVSFYCALIGLSSNFCQGDLGHLKALYPGR
ncbi:MAG: molecular chaperone TorD family protein [Candidatus Lindowbacteria bacterium]|nr:molecular chaperone TorD family protein [Candidatus Lindowbacteria bacterium]